MKGINLKLQQFIKTFPLPSNWKLWFALALLVKTAIFIFKIQEGGAYFTNFPQSFALGGGDARSYIDPIENLLAQGSYHDDYRMPGYGWLYFLLRLIFSVGNALNAIAIIQVVLSSVSVYVLALIARHIFKSDSYFYMCFFLYVISTYVSLFDYQILTESFCTAALIFSVYYLITANESKAKLFLAGLFLTWSIFLRPITAPVLIIFAIYVLIKNRKPIVPSLRSQWSRLLIFLLPFILIDGSWVIRNYRKYNEITPLTRSVYYPSFEKTYLVSMFNFVNAFGGSIVYWNPGSEISFFEPTSDYIKKKVEVQFPSSIYTSKFNYDSLVVIQQEIQAIKKDTVEAHREQLTNTVKAQFDAYALSIKEEKPFLYYISSRFKTIKRFFIHSGTYNLFNKTSMELNKLELLIKVIYSLIYVFAVLFGFAGILGLWMKDFRNADYNLIAFLSLYLAFIYPFILKFDEFRYFVTAYPFFIVASTYTLIGVYKFFLKFK